MNAIILIVWNYLKQNNRWAIALLFILFLFGLIILNYKNNKINKLKHEINSEINFRSALLDSIKYYKNENNELVSEKLTIQTTIDKLIENFNQLNNNQKELVNRIIQLDKNNKTIVAALYNANVKIDSLLAKDGVDGNVITIDTTKKMININNLTSLDTSFIYDIDVNGVVPAKFGIKPNFLFKKIEIPNKQFIEFHWKNDKKRGYPISFTVTNSNKYIKVTNMDSYAIPQLDKKHLNPNGWQKIENFLIKNGKTIFYVGIGGIVGVGGYHILTQ